MSRSLTDTVNANRQKIRFHTPGHSGQLDKNLMDCDVTELSYSDNLLSPTGIINELEKKLASAYNVEACFISTQGATANIFMAIFACKSKGDFLIVGKAHVSIYNAMRLFNARAYHVDSFQEEFLQDNIKTVIVTSPDYFGNTLDLKYISQHCREKNVTLIVDASHGSHFQFSEELPLSATNYGDLVIHSLHKTMPVMTGGSVLCAKKEYVNNVILARKLLFSTSPNYVTMCSIDRAIDEFLTRGNEYYKAIKEEINKFKNALNSDFAVERNDDFSRLVVSSKYVGKEVEKALFNLGYACEMSYENKVVFIVTPYNYKHLPKLAEDFDKVKGISEYLPSSDICTRHPTPTAIPFGGEAELVDLNQSINRRAFLEVGFYPPGVPFLYSGDLITEEKIAILQKEMQYKEVFGLDNNGIYVLK